VTRKNWRLAAATKHLDRWREVARCFSEFDQPASLLFAYLGARSLDYPHVATHRSGLKLRLMEFGDLETIWQVFLRHVYDVRPTDQTIVDIGANVGLFACYAAWKAPRARVLAVEPFPTSVERLREHLSQNHLSDRVTVLPAALAPNVPEVVMAVNRHSSQENYVVTNVRAEMQTVRVPAISLERALAEAPGRIDLLKMDIEGGEFEVLLNAKPSELRRCSRINLEHHAAPSGSGYRKENLIEHLVAAGFLIRQHLGTADSDYGILHCEQAAA